MSHVSYQERFPQYKIPVGEDKPEKLETDNSRAQQELGLKYTPLHKTIIDGAVSLIQLGARLNSYYVRLVLKHAKNSRIVL